MSLYSPYWYRAEELTPRLKRHCSIARQIHRKRVWYVIANRTNGDFFRVSEPAYALIGLMNGERTVDDIWRQAARILGNDLPTQDEFIELLAKLYHSDLLNTGTAHDPIELSERRKKRNRSAFLTSLRNPFAIRIPLFDPDNFLTRLLPFFRPLLSTVGLIAFLALIAYAIILAALNWPELSNDITSQVFLVETVFIAVLVYPLIKAAHEIGHGLAIKHWGGEVRETGVMFLFLMPVPYVDASAAALWPDKHRRAVVSAIGVFSEIAISALAMVVWVNSEPGALRSVAFTTMVIGGISTLVFNGNPLLRFDGYYVLSDLLEIPNLGKRSNDYVGHLIKRHAFGSTQSTFPALAPGERGWLVVYSVAAYCYRVTVAIAIAFLVSGWLFALGLLLAAWALLQMLVLPILKALKTLFLGESLMRVRRRAITVTLVTVAILTGILMLLPLPYGYVSRAVVWTNSDNIVVASGSGFIVKTPVEKSNKLVLKGATLFELKNELIASQHDAAQAQLKAIRLGLEAGRASGPAAARRSREQLAQAEAALARAKAQLDDLLVRSPSNGRFVPADTRNSRGRYIQQGETLGYIVQPTAKLLLRIVVPEGAVDLIRAHNKGIRVAFPHNPTREYRAEIIRQIPGVERTLPSLALSNVGAGPFKLDPTGGKSLRTLAQVATFEARLVDVPPPVMIGATADVRVNLGWSPLGLQLWRPILQSLLKSAAG